jgi:lipid-A-disaccharide synthase-like uncharacterized protein
MNEGLLRPLLSGYLPWLFRESLWWTAFGLLGNVLFTSRFIFQWAHSERLGRIEVPRIFWHLSFWGSVISLVYSFHIDKLPVILGYLFLPVLYARNLVLLSRTGRSVPDQPGGSTP